MVTVAPPRDAPAEQSHPDGRMSQMIAKNIRGTIGPLAMVAFALSSPSPSAASSGGEAGGGNPLAPPLVGAAGGPARAFLSTATTRLLERQEALLPVAERLEA